MEYYLNDINVYIIKDAIYFCIGDKSILDDSKTIPLFEKTRADIFDYVKLEGVGVYYTSKLPIACVDFLRKKHIKGKTAKEILETYHRLLHMGFGMGDFLESCKYTKISKEKLLDLFSDLANGFDRKKAIVKTAIKLGTDDLSSISEKTIEEELLNIKKERIQNQSQLYTKIEKELV